MAKIKIKCPKCGRSLKCMATFSTGIVKGNTENRWWSCDNCDTDWETEHKYFFFGLFCKMTSIKRKFWG